MPTFFLRNRKKSYNGVFQNFFCKNFLENLIKEVFKINTCIMKLTAIRNVLAIIEYIYDDIAWRDHPNFKPDLDLLTSILTKFNALNIESVTDEEWYNLKNLIHTWWESDEPLDEMLESLPVQIKEEELIDVIWSIIENPKKYFNVLSDIKKALKDTGAEEQQELGEI